MVMLLEIYKQRSVYCNRIFDEVRVLAEEHQPRYHIGGGILLLIWIKMV